VQHNFRLFTEPPC